MTGSPEPAALSAAETRAAGALLARALGEEIPISAAVYLLAPFPSCWCFASLPTDAAPALEAYRGCLRAAGIDPGPGWDTGVAAALACWLVARGDRLAGLLEEDPEWERRRCGPGCWRGCAASPARPEGPASSPRLRALTAALDDQLSRRWPGVVIPDYPALAQPGSPLARVPGGWWPGL